MNEREKRYKEANALFLKTKEEEGIYTKHQSGMLYRKIKEGVGGTVFPRTNSIVFVHYTGKLIDGKVIDTTEDGHSLPACFVVRELIMGWQIALTKMRAGDRFEIILPYDLGYGKKRCDDIPGYSTLIFELELIKVEQR